jgi:hypothetical protein
MQTAAWKRARIVAPKGDGEGAFSLGAQICKDELTKLRTKYLQQDKASTQLD